MNKLPETRKEKVSAKIKVTNLFPGAPVAGQFPYKDCSRICATIPSIFMDTFHQTAPESTRGLFDLPEHVSEVFLFERVGYV